MQSLRQKHVRSAEKVVVRADCRKVKESMNKLDSRSVVADARLRVHVLDRCGRSSGYGEVVV